MKTKTFDPGLVLLWICAAVLLALTLFPFLWILRTSFTGHTRLFDAPLAFWPPEATTDNYARVLGFITGEAAVRLGGSGQKIDFVRALLNSVLVCSVTTVVQTLSCAMGAYAFARLKFPGRNGLFLVYLSALMVPGIVMTIPNFVLVKEWGWLNTYLGILAPGLLMTPFSVFFLRQFFLGINPELEEAAFLDGAGKARTFVQIILPLAQTALVTLALSLFISGWNDYLWPLLVGKDESVRLLNVAMGIFRSQTPQGSPDWGGLMAGAVLSILPLLALFVVFGKRIVNSISFSGFR
jgi:multiple sugar transport system permease protein